MCTPIQQSDRSTDMTWPMISTVDGIFATVIGATAKVYRTLTEMVVTRADIKIMHNREMDELRYHHIAHTHYPLRAK